MRTSYLIALLCLLGCSQEGVPNATDKQERLATVNQNQQAPASVTSESVIHVDALPKGNPAEHPLMCRPDGDYPEGTEMCFRRRESAGPVHAVFPKGVAAPENLEGTFILHGHFQGIQNWDAFTPTDTRKLVKVPPKDYQYFVVSSWEHSD